MATATAPTGQVAPQVRGLLGELRAGLGPDTAAATVEAVQVVLDEATALRWEAVRLLDRARRGEPTRRGRDTAAELAEQCELPRGEARRVVGAARVLDQLPGLAAAVEAGAVAPAAVEAICRAGRGPAELFALAAVEDDLVEVARTCHPDEVARRARWMAAAAEAVQRRTRTRQRAARRLRLHPAHDGLTRVEGLLLPEVAEAWRTLLDARVKATYRQARAAKGPDREPDAGAEPPQVDERTAAQRTHDAFGQIAADLMHAQIGPQVHRAAATILICIDLATFDPAGHDPALLQTLGIDVERIRAAARALLPPGSGLLPETGGLLPAGLVRRLATTAGARLIPLLFDGSTPLARGRTLRHADHDIRLGLITRDQGCVDCGAPPLWCDADHHPDWDAGGHTNPDQLTLRCRKDHVHRHHTDTTRPDRGHSPRRAPP